MKGITPAAAERAGPEPRPVGHLAVSKLQPATAVAASAPAGQREFGENYVQEGVGKIAALGDAALTWHFIGQVQSNKTREVAEHFAWVHTVDRDRIAARLHAQRPHYAGPLEVLVQVRLGDEPGKGGIAPSDAPRLAEVVAGLPRLRLRGLMCLPAPARDEAAHANRSGACGRSSRTSTVAATASTRCPWE